MFDSGPGLRSLAHSDFLGSYSFYIVGGISNSHWSPKHFGLSADSVAHRKRPQGLVCAAPQHVQSASAAELDFALDQAFYISVGLWFASALAIFIAWRYARSTTNYHQRIMAGFTIVWALYFSPHAHCYDMLLLVLPAVLTLPCISPDRAWSLKPLCLRLWTLALLSFPVLGWVLFILTFNPAIAWRCADILGSPLLTLFLLIVGFPMFSRAIQGHKLVHVTLRQPD